MAETEHLWVHSEGQHLFPAAPLQKLNQELPWELPICQPHLCASEDLGTDPSISYAKAHGGQGGDSRQPAWLHQGQVLPD